MSLLRKVRVSMVFQGSASKNNEKQCVFKALTFWNSKTHNVYKAKQVFSWFPSVLFFQGKSRAGGEPPGAPDCEMESWEAERVRSSASEKLDSWKLTYMRSSKLGLDHKISISWWQHFVNLFIYIENMCVIIRGCLYISITWTVGNSYHRASCQYVS